MDNKTLHEIVREAEENFQTGTVTISEHVTHNLYDTLSTIDAYLNSFHTSGPTDSQGREKPFFNIVVAAANIWYRATDLDTRGIKFLPPSLSKTLHTYAAYALLQEWMRKNNFGLFLNQWGLTLARYGSAVCKFIEVDGELKASVIPWNSLIVDPIDFYALPRIEKLYKTPAHLLHMATKGHPDYAGYDLEKVKDLITSKTTRKTQRGLQKDNMDEFIELYEVHGELSQATYNESKGLDFDEKDEEIFFQQMHVVSFLKNNEGKFEDYTLFSGKEKQDLYMLTHLLEEDGRTLGKGAVEYLFDAQWMVNHTMKNMKDYLDLASKLLFQTSDPNFLGRNVLTSIENGNIFITKVNEPVTQVANNANNIGALTAYLNQWRIGGQDTSATPDALRGTTQPSGTSGIQVQALQEQAMSLFDMMSETKKMYLNQMIRKFIIPNLKKKMDTVKEVSAILNDDGIKEVDASFVPAEAVRKFNEKTVDNILNLDPTQPLETQNLPQPFDPMMAQMDVQSSLASMGNKRTFKPDDMDEKAWSDVLKNFEWEIVIDDGESQNKRELFTALQSFIQVVRTNPLVNQVAGQMIQPGQLGQPGMQSQLQSQLQPNTQI